MPFHFSEICVFLQRHEDLCQRQPPLLSRADRSAHSRAITESWFKSHRSAIAQLDVDSSVALLSTLLPERRTDRVYNIGAPRLVHILSRCLGLSAARAKDLHAYTQPGCGDLGESLERVLQNGGPPARPPVTLDEVDEVLYLLAGGCRFSDPAIQKLPPGSSEVRDRLIGNLLKRMQPGEAKWLVRLILKDFAPVRLNEAEILKNYHFLLPGILRFQDKFDAAIRLLNGPLNDYPSHPDSRSERLHFESAATHLKPTVGVKVGRPNFHKARSIDHCMRMLGGNQWVLERKYDGEYCEIHVDLARSTNPYECITIFSKSGKNSTADRQQLHVTLVESLQLGKPGCKIKRQAILLGEMVVYSDKDRQLKSFDEIRKHVLRSGRAIGTDADSLPKAGEHLAIVFFDILLLDDEIVMNRPVEDRRKWLREVYRKIDGRAMSAEWKVVNFAAETSARRLLMQQFAASIAQRCEGLVLKPCGVPYFALDISPAHFAHSYVKLKKDYILDMGDEADLTVVGGSYNAQQAATCGVSGVKWTEFHLGCLMNKPDVLRFDARPKFKVVGSIQQDHCIPTATLQAANALATFCATPYKANDVPANFDLDIPIACRLDTIFNAPFVFEVLGAGFEKPSNCNFYMLRHTRVKKLHEDRTWKNALSMQELQEQAAAARSILADSESQETRVWLQKLESRCRKKFERERTGTPKTTTTATPSTTVPSTRRRRAASVAAVNRGTGLWATSSPVDTSALDGTTLIAEPSPKSVKRRRDERAETPCPVWKRQRLQTITQPARPTALLSDITNLAPIPSGPDLLTRLTSSLKRASTNLPMPGPLMLCAGPTCPLHNTILHLSPCIRNAPYIASDLLASHLLSGCTILTPSLSHWERQTGDHLPLTGTVSESPAWKGRRKVLLVEGRRWGATGVLVGRVMGLGKGLAGERVEVRDWRILEGIENGELLGLVEWDMQTERVRLVEGMEWLREAVEGG